MDHIPNNMRMAAVKMSNYSRNRFRLETVSNDTAKAGRIVTVNLPEGGAICDLKSFKMHMDVTTTQATAGTRTVFGRLPADAASLISRVEVYLNGVQLQQGAAEYNTICRILKIGRSSRDKDSSIDRSLSHGAITTADAVEDVSMVMSDWKGFLGETSCRFIDTGLLGQLQVHRVFGSSRPLVIDCSDRQLTPPFQGHNSCYSDAEEQHAGEIDTLFVFHVNLQPSRDTAGPTPRTGRKPRRTRKQSLRLQKSCASVCGLSWQLW